MAKTQHFDPFIMPLNVLVKLTNIPLKKGGGGGGGSSGNYITKMRAVTSRKRHTSFIFVNVIVR